MKSYRFTFFFLFILFVPFTRYGPDNNLGKISGIASTLSRGDRLPFFQITVVKDEQTEKKKFEEISKNLYKFKGACNVYLLKAGSSGILIDAGSSELMEYLDEIGVQKIDWILHTHYHRDQCTGDLRMKREGAKVAIGELEAGFLQPVEANVPFRIPESFLLNGELPDWGRGMTPFQKPGVDRKFAEGDVFHWKQYDIKVINTPGHTKGSVTYMVDIDSQKICSSGDLIMSGGHIHDLYSMQWIYLANPGVDSSITSVRKLKSLDIDIFLPSHGEIIFDPLDEMELLTVRLKKFRDSFDSKNAGRWNWSGFVQVSSHVIQDCGSTSQIIISKTGEALLFDCGKELTTDRWEEAKRKFGIKKVSVIIPSHWH
jgi:glyoxylase-like metal-dependent hydrolase (beta-lactamase superfamily II)